MGSGADEPISFTEFQVFTFGSDQELVAVYGSMDSARDAWLRVREEFMRRWDLWGRPSAWWKFEPDIPDELRSGPHAIITPDDALAWERLEEGRRRHLVSLGIDPAPDRRHRPFAG